MLVLGFDPSMTAFGWAVHGTVPLKGGLFQTSSKTLFTDRYVDLREKVRATVIAQGVRRVGVEYPVFGEIQTPGLYGLFLYTCEALRQEKCDVVFFSPGQAKAHARLALGRPKGWKMLKPDMVEAAKLVSGFSGRLNHNVADGFWIARSAFRFWSYFDGVITDKDLTEPEKSQFAAIHTFRKGKRAGETVHKGILFREDERFFQWSKE